MLGTVQTVNPAPVFAPGVVAHFKIDVTTAAATLDSLVSGGIPTTSSGAKPTGVYLAVQDGETNKVFFTFDGQSTPAAALGFLLPAQPAPPVFIPFQSGGYVAGIVQLVAVGGTTAVQVKFDWGSSLG